MSAEPLKVLYLGGGNRSGSTLLDRALGQMPGHVSVGELSMLWRLSLRRDWPCGCGRPFSACEFWVEVGRKAFGGWSEVDAEKMRDLQLSLDRFQYIPLLAAGRGPGEFSARLDRYLDILERIYTAVRDVSGASVVVDSSKWPSTVYLLARAKSLDVRLVHLVRDPRGVVYSWSKADLQNQPGGAIEKTGKMPVWTTRHTVRHWMTTNLALEAAGARGVPRLLVRYDDFIAQPARELGKVSALLGNPLAPDALDFVTDAGLQLGVSHTAAGNPSRFRTGLVPLKRDDAWRTAMPERQRKITTVGTFPLLKRYGF